MKHFQITFKVGDNLQYKVIYARNKIDACTRFIACYPYNIVNVIPFNRPITPTALKVA